MQRNKLRTDRKRQLKRLVAGVLLASVMTTSMPMTGVYAAVSEMTSYGEEYPVSYRFSSAFTDETETRKEITLEAYAEDGYTIDSIQSPDGKIQGGGVYRLTP